MRFQYAPDMSYKDVGSGHVLYSAPGFPAFPARLSIELFERARHAVGVSRASLWDPMCGAGGMATTLGLTCSDSLRQILATDICGDAVSLAQRNLKLISSEGLAHRSEELRQIGADPSRIVSAERLAKGIKGQVIKVRAAVADSTDRKALLDLNVGNVDIVLTDLPYGAQTHWQSASETPLLAMLDALRHVLPRHSVMVFASTDRRAFDGAPKAFRSFKYGRRTIKMYRWSEAH